MRDRRVFLLLLASLGAAGAIRPAKAANGPRTRPIVGRKSERTVDACDKRQADGSCASAK